MELHPKPTLNTTISLWGAAETVILVRVTELLQQSGKHFSSLQMSQGTQEDPALLLQLCGLRPRPEQNQ